MKMIPLTEAKDDLSAVIRRAEREQIVITRHGKPAAVIVGFENEEDWIEYRMLNDPKFMKRIAEARADIRAGRFTRLEDLPH
jgi:prevent-host-death family protein